MTNAIDTYWEVDGQSIQTLAYNIETLGGTATPPKFRGEDEEIPHRPGERWLPKVVSSRTIPLAMWVVGSNPDGSIDRARADIFEDNLRALRRLFWTPGRQIQLTKRFKVNGVMRSATALAEYESGLDDKRIGRAGAKFLVNLKLADPYFYDDVDTTVNLVNGPQDVVLEGDAPTQHINLTINGSRNQPKVLNDTTDVEVTYNAELLVGERVELDVDAYEARVFPASGPSFRAGGRIIHAGAPHWLDLRPGVNSLVVSSTSGTGSVVLNYREAWL